MNEFSCIWIPSIHVECISLDSSFLEYLNHTPDVVQMACHKKKKKIYAIVVGFQNCTQYLFQVFLLVVVVVFVVDEIVVVVEDEVALAEVLVVVVGDGVGLVAGAVEEAEEEEVEEDEDVEVMENNYNNDHDHDYVDDSVLVH